MGRGEVMVVPRTSRFVIELCADERDELERRAREVTAPWRDVQRARMILYAAQGMADIEIAARLDCHPDSVSHRRRRFCAERLEALQDKPRAGRPRRFPPGAGRRGRRGRVRAAGPSRPAAGALPAPGAARPGDRAGVTDASATTIWRWLHDRSLKPWQQRSWIFPRDPDFQPKAGRVLDLY